MAAFTRLHASSSFRPWVEEGSGATETTTCGWHGGTTQPGAQGTAGFVTALHPTFAQNCRVLSSIFYPWEKTLAILWKGTLRNSPKFVTAQGGTDHVFGSLCSSVQEYGERGGREGRYLSATREMCTCTVCSFRAYFVPGFCTEACCAWHEFSVPLHFVALYVSNAYVRIDQTAQQASIFDRIIHRVLSRLLFCATLPRCRMAGKKSPKKQKLRIWNPGQSRKRGTEKE